MDLELENEFEWPEKGDHEDSVRIIEESANYPEDGMIPIEVFTLGDKQDWTPQTEEDFEWLLRKLHGYKAEERQFSAKLKARVDEAKSSYAYYLSKYGLPFSDWVKAQVEAKAKKPLAEIKRGKSLRMELGTPGFKSVGGEIEIDVKHPYFQAWMIDQLQMQERALQQNIDSFGQKCEIVEFSWRPNIMAIKSCLEHVKRPGEAQGQPMEMDLIVDKDTGEVVEWATWIPERQEFTIRF